MSDAPHDARIAAWIAAWQRLQAVEDMHRQAYPTSDQAATKEREAWQDRHTNRLLREAEILTALTQVPHDVAYVAGSYIEMDTIRRNLESPPNMDDYGFLMDNQSPEATDPKD